MKHSGKAVFIAISINLVLIIILGLLGACSSSPNASTSVSSSPLTTSSVSSAKPITLVFTEFEAANSFWDTEFARPWFAELEKRTNGRVKVEAHWGGEIAGLFDAYDTIFKGTADFGKILPTFFADKFPMDGAIIYGPVNQTNHRPTQFWLDLYNEFPEMQAPYANTPLLALAPMPCNGTLTTKNRTISKIDDVKGLKFPGAGPAAESRLKAAGIVPVSLQPSETYMAFKTGTLDGIAAALPSVSDFGWGDVLTNCSLVDLNGSPWAYVMNKNTWNNLPPDIQKIMKDMIPWLADLNEKVQYKVDQAARTGLIQKYGLKITELSQAELDKWAAADNPTLDAYIAANVTAKNLPGDKLKSEFYRLWTKYSAPEFAQK
jgi:TRAP-type C4-dicarboxylate transport system substrate-binding protein